MKWPIAIPSAATARVGYEFLREAIANDFAARGVNVGADEIFISDSAKCDTANILDILGHQNRIAIANPVYPYLDTNVMAGHFSNANDAGQYEGIVYLPCTAENNFVSRFPHRENRHYYLCYPNNPTGATAAPSRSPVGWRTPGERRHHPVRCRLRALSRTATCAFHLRDRRRAHCAVSYSFSKNAGFTGTIAPSRLCPKD